MALPPGDAKCKKADKGAPCKRKKKAGDADDACARIPKQEKTSVKVGYIGVPDVSKARIRQRPRPNSRFA